MLHLPSSVSIPTLLYIFNIYVHAVASFMNCTTTNQLHAYSCIASRVSVYGAHVGEQSLLAIPFVQRDSQILELLIITTRAIMLTKV